MTLKHAEIDSRFEMIENELLNRPQRTPDISFGAPLPLIHPIQRGPPSELHPPPEPATADAIIPPVAPSLPRAKPQSIRSSIISELKILMQKNRELHK